MTMRETLRPYAGLCKARIAFLASLTAAAGFLLAGGPAAAAAAPVAGVFLLACGACALNQWQERETDARMARTAARPIPSGRVRPAAALRFSWLLIASGGALLLLADSREAPLLGFAALFWYNGVYTPLKSRSAFAAIPGALTGAIPPAVGWTAAGGGLCDPPLAALCFFFFMWQVPHSFAHLAAFGKEYASIGLPSLTAVFTVRQLYRLTFQWLLAAAVSLQLIAAGGLVVTFPVRAALLAASLWLAAAGIRLLKKEEPGFPGLFRGINNFMLVVLLLIHADAVPRYFA
ncbi:MAG TPA: UbiA family prenyltransferase [Syntrophales bacterium]|nr:UbiA family prenyltransferase [Syntrophales bacterium]